MLWERRIQIAKETKATLNSDAMAGEIRNLKTEVHVLQVWHAASRALLHVLSVIMHYSMRWNRLFNVLHCYMSYLLSCITACDGIDCLTYCTVTCPICYHALQHAME